ncbi:hypothetical protein AKI39_01095 [Bordetella sp. H567]|uniref:hypothetical protein n=1 Tax=Bordetella sp. H567 TaxID=1697043 RepID=UPI00081D2503|nr:hypothetical protein [Bordetella sp. H567]AOB29572.1 hypothetical protein AKI39_01095 [Bordetella sp. H567]
MNKRYRIGALCAGVLLAGGMTGGMAVAQAQQAQQAPANRLAVRGKIEQITDTTLLVKARNGKDVSMAIPPNVAVRAVSLAKLGDIKPDSFIGTAATPQPDGTLKALEVHVFAASLRGSGEGNRPWEGADGKTGQMTNGTVGSLVGTNGTTMKVKYKDGEKTVVVPPDVPIVYMEPGDRALLKTGAPVLVFPTKNADGSLTASTIVAGKDGTIPPM